MLESRIRIKELKKVSFRTRHEEKLSLERSEKSFALDLSRAKDFSLSFEMTRFYSAYGAVSSPYHVSYVVT